MTDAEDRGHQHGTDRPGGAGRPPLASGDKPDHVKPEGHEDEQDPDEEDHRKPAEPERL